MENWIYYPQGKTSLSETEWADLEAIRILNRKGGQQNKSYMHRIIRTAQGKPVRSEQVWGKFISKIQTQGFELHKKKTGILEPRFCQRP